MNLTRKNINLFWNRGRILGIILIFQIFRGILIFFFYSNESDFSFFSINYTTYESFFGWFIRLLHHSFVRLFFIIIIFHIFKNLICESYKMKKVWFFGLIILLLLILESFLGYVLIWSQIRFWACVVITSFVRVLPFVGFKIIYWIWRGFSITSFVLKFFYFIHFILPFFILIIVFFHIYFLHEYKRTSININRISNIYFYPNFIIKDFYNFIILLLFIIFFLFYPFSIGDIEIFIEKNEINRPIHIIPEWYFLYFYCILRSIPNKITGIIILFFSLSLYFIFLCLNNYKTFFNNYKKIICLVLLLNLFLLSYLGQSFVEYPFTLLGLIIIFIHLKIFRMIFYIYSNKRFNF